MSIYSISGFIRRVGFAAMPFLIVALTLISCQNPTASVQDVSVQAGSDKTATVRAYVEVAFANYEDAHAAALTLRSALQTLVASPTPATLAAARTAWLQARLPYGQTEAFRFSSGPVDDADGPEGRLNAWPMDEGYIDYIATDGATGIINQTATYPAITQDVLAALNEQGGETHISTGWHAIEFLLWGQDLTSPSATLTGQRPATDFAVGGTASNQARRGQYLLACADLLVVDLASLVDEWKPNATNYRAAFLALPPDSALQRILTGISSLSGGELSGERLTVALQSGEQEDEHSCFSDNTRIDVIENARGIQNIWLGRYTRTDGTVIDGRGLDELVASRHSSIAETLTAQIAESFSKAQALQSPFDFEISPSNSAGNARVQATVAALQAQTTSIAAAAQALGIRINVE